MSNNSEKKHFTPILGEDGLLRFQSTEQKDVEIPASSDLDHKFRETKSQSIPLNTVTTKPIKWLYPGKIPLSKLTILAGDPDVGKTFLTLDIASRVSTGTNWPDGAENVAGNVLILSAEDDLSDTIVPRLKSANANLDRIHSLQTLTKYDSKAQKSFETIPTLTNDFEALEKEISLIQPKLLIIDPINAYLPGIDTHRDAELRAKVFAPLKNLAEKYETAILCVMHLNKGSSQNAKHRISGSIAYVAASRGTWLIVADKDDSTRKVMIPVKFNIGPKPDGMAYKIIQNDEGQPVIAWEKDPVDLDADEALQIESTHSSEREAAKDFLLEILSNGPVAAKEIMQEAQDFEISKRTLYRAKDRLNIKSFRKGEEGVQGGGVWHWELPE